MKKAKALILAAVLLLLCLPIGGAAAEAEGFQPVPEGAFTLLTEAELPVADIYDVALNERYIAAIYKLPSSGMVYAVFDQDGGFVYAYKTTLAIRGTQHYVEEDGSVVIRQTRTKPDKAYRLCNPREGGGRVYSFPPEDAIFERLRESSRTKYTVRGTARDRLVVQNADGSRTVIFDHSAEYLQKYGALGAFLRTNRWALTAAGILLAVGVVAAIGFRGKRAGQGRGSKR